MGPEGHSIDPLFGTHARAILDIWDQMQRLQTDFALPQELTFFYTSPQWHAARTVLDLGTGNGYYLAKLAARFPGKTYYGVDASAELIAIACREAAAEHVIFSQRDLFEATQRCDFVLMRLLLQHLADVRAVLDHVAALTSPGASVLIVDADDAARFFHPAFPEFMQFFAAHVEHERKGGRDRRVASRVEAAVASTPLWRLGARLPVLIPSTIPGNLDLFSRTYELFVDLVQQAGELKHDFAGVKAAWQRWAERPGAYAQVGLNLIRLERV